MTIDVDVSIQFYSSSSPSLFHTRSIRYSNVLKSTFVIATNTRPTFFLMSPLQGIKPLGVLASFPLLL